MRIAGDLSVYVGHTTTDLLSPRNGTNNVHDYLGHVIKEG